MDYIIYEGYEYIPQTEEFFKLVFSGYDYCEECITFDERGRATMPGFQTSSIHGDWALKNDSLYISNVDTFANVYDGVYEVVFSRNGLILKSEKTTLSCYPRIPIKTKS